MNHILERNAELLKNTDDVLVDNCGLFTIIVSDTFCELAGCRVSGPLCGDVCDRGVGWNNSDGGEEAFVGWGAGGGVEVLERHCESYCGCGCENVCDFFARCRDDGKDVLKRR